MKIKGKSKMQGEGEVGGEKTKDVRAFMRGQTINEPGEKERKAGGTGKGTKN